MSVGQSISRVDGYDKVTGRAMFTQDLIPGQCLVAKVLHAAIGNGRVIRMDLTRALKVPGVVKIVTYKDVPKCQYPTPGHPWSVEKAHQDVADRRILTDRVRYYGDDIAAVIAEDEVAASRALKLIDVEYEEYPVVTDPRVSMKGTVVPVHEEYPDNILASSSYEIGSVDEAMSAADVVFHGVYKTNMVQHCHLEPPVSYAYMEKGRIVIVTSTQIPHIVRRVCGQALGIPWGKIRVIKPYIGGGFGNKQDVLYEPLNAFLTTQVGGRPVLLEISREETFVSTRTRHAIEYDLTAGVKSDGHILGKAMEAISNQGGYASHGHSIVANGATAFRHLYDIENVRASAFTVYTNTPVGGAMRGYGIPQFCFAQECMMDDIARKLSMDPLQLREKNVHRGYFADPFLKEIAANTNGAVECMEKGRAYIHWDEKRKAYENQTGNLKKGVGMALFSYKTGVYPISLEIAGARMTLNQDGSIMLCLGATEIGQGADTVFGQMAAKTLGISVENVHIETVQDTDQAPFDTGAYASRQTYITGTAIKDCALALREKILEKAAALLGDGTKAEVLSLEDGEIYMNNEPVMNLESLAMECYYSLTDASVLSAEVSRQVKNNTIAFGCCFAEVEVDINLGRVRILDMINVHDSGILINPMLAKMQVHGGMSMGIGYGLSEQLLVDSKNGRVLNGTLLDYKLPTMMDAPDLSVDFVELDDPTGPYGNKALGEPPAIPVAPAIRNAVLHATGVAVNELPLSPQRCFEAFKAAGLL